MKRYISLIVAFVFGITTVMSQSLTDKEKDLFYKIMSYRKQHGLSDIPISKSLNIVAKTHVNDLQQNYQLNNDCNLHSWSNKGKWLPVCYKGSASDAKLMWSKPSELTAYKGNGYEIAFYSSGTVDTQKALNVWQSSKGHNNIILNKDIWSSSKFNAIGIGISDNYAVVWFGTEIDK